MDVKVAMQPLVAGETWRIEALRALLEHLLSKESNDPEKENCKEC